MNYIILFILIVTSFDSFGQRPFKDCGQYTEFFNDKFEKMEEASEKFDVSDQAAFLSKSINHYCGKNMASSGQVILKKIEKDGYNNYINFLVKEAQRVSDFRVPTWEKSELERISKLAGVTNPLTKEKERLLGIFGKSNSRKRRSECSSVDNRKEPLVEFVDGKMIDRPRDQDSIGWCYAFTAADLISHKVGMKVSAIDVANTYNNSTFKNFIGYDETEITGGFSDDAANSSLEKGLCLESQLPSDDYRFSTDSNLFKEYQKIEKLYEIFRERTSDPGLLFGRNSFKGKKYSDASKSFEQDLACNKLEGEFNVLFPAVSLGDFMGIIKKSSSANNFIDNLVDRSCKKRIPNTQGLEFEEDGPLTTKNAMVKTIDQKLDDGDILGVNYRADTLKNLLENDTDSAHASLIVAREFNEETGSCEYLVRNSWGNTSGGFDPRTRSESGNHWVPEEYLRQTMYGLTYVK